MGNNNKSSPTKPQGLNNFEDIKWVNAGGPGVDSGLLLAKFQQSFRPVSASARRTDDDLRGLRESGNVLRERFGLSRAEAKVTTKGIVELARRAGQGQQRQENEEEEEEEGEEENEDEKEEEKEEDEEEEAKEA